jgi:hypothetical protein
MLPAVAKEIVMTFMDMAPYMLLGLTFAGILHVFIDKDFIAKHLGGNNVSSVLKAALFGVPLPLCSCGVLPVALSLRKGRASDGATVSFLISTPQTGIDSIVATWGLLGPLYAVFRPVAALVMGIIGGLAVIPFSKAPHPAHASAAHRFSCTLCFEPSPHSHTLGYKSKRVFTYAFVDFLDDISAQLAIGIIVSGVIASFVPNGFFDKNIGNELVSMLLMAVVGVPMYICATASIPIAVALMLKGLSPGAAFVFLAVGSATNIPFMLVIADAMGKKVLAVYLSVLMVLSLVMGFTLNALFGLVETQWFKEKIIQDFSEPATLWTVVPSCVFLALMLLSLGRLLSAKVRETMAGRHKGVRAGPATRVISIEGMSCHNCAKSVLESLNKVRNVLAVSVSVKDSTATVTGDADIGDITAAIEDAGFTVK